MDRTIVSSRREASFKVNGVTCRAWVYEPNADASPDSQRLDSGRRAACIVMAHGLGGTRDASLEPYALRFAAAGFFVVLFDYRYLGASDGEPRQLISPRLHLQDWRAAIAFARALPGVDPARIGLWGTSLSGGHVIVAASRDSRVAAVAAQCPMLDGIASARLAMQRGTMRGVRVRLAAAMSDVTRAMFGFSPRYVPLVARKGELGVMASDKAYEGILSIVPPGWCNEVAARILFTLPMYRPVRHAGKVKCPTLLVACGQDTIVSAKAAAETADRIGESARLVTLPIDHFDIYKGEWFERGCGEQVAFFRKALQES